MEPTGSNHDQHQKAGRHSQNIQVGRDLYIGLDNTPSIDRASIVSLIKQELSAEQYAHIDEAGHSTAERITLARVYVDAQAAMSHRASTEVVTSDIETADDDGPRHLLAQQQASALRPTSGAISLLSEHLSVQKTSKDSTGDLAGVGATPADVPDTARFSRFLLLGAPGQGKSTLIQLSAQLMRAELLRQLEGDESVRAATSRASADLEAVLNDLEQFRVREAIAVPPARLPFIVPLPALADALDEAGDRNVSILDFIAIRISKRLNLRFDRADLVNWMKMYPAVLFLDGLDEVPPTSNRAKVIRAVQNLLEDVDTHDLSTASILISTRPQGYDGELDRDRFNRMTMLPMSRIEAQRYGELVASVRYGLGDDKSGRVIDILTAAFANPSVASLMRTPLGVTMIIALIGGGGHPPEERWSLYQEYFKLVYLREIERSNATSALLKQYRAEIITIHGLVAYTLHSRAEVSGEATTRMSRDDFLSVVTRYLDSEGYTSDSLAREIVDAAMIRLVFLVGLDQSGSELGFEHRTMQEYFAAERIMHGPDPDVVKRLNEIGPRSHWRTVFLFCAGHCALGKTHLRDSVIAVCADLNNTIYQDGISGLGLGSELAVDLLSDGIRQPNYGRRVLRQAFSALTSLTSSDLQRLAVAAEGFIDEMRAETELQITQRLQEPPRSADNLAGWHLLLFLAERGAEWAIALCNLYWPKQFGLAELELISNMVPYPERRDDDYLPELEVYGGSFTLSKLLSSDLSGVALPSLMPYIETFEFDLRTDPMLDGDSSRVLADSKKSVLAILDYCAQFPAAGYSNLIPVKFRGQDLFSLKLPLIEDPSVRREGDGDLHEIFRTGATTLPNWEPLYRRQLYERTGTDDTFLAFVESLNDELQKPHVPRDSRHFWRRGLDWYAASLVAGLDSREDLRRIKELSAKQALPTIERRLAVCDNFDGLSIDFETFEEFAWWEDVVEFLNDPGAAPIAVASARFHNPDRDVIMSCWGSLPPGRRRSLLSWFLCVDWPGLAVVHGQVTADEALTMLEEAIALTNGTARLTLEIFDHATFPGWPSRSFAARMAAVLGAFSRRVLAEPLRLNARASKFLALLVDRFDMYPELLMLATSIDTVAELVGPSADRFQHQLVHENRVVRHSAAKLLLRHEGRGVTLDPNWGPAFCDILVSSDAVSLAVQDLPAQEWGGVAMVCLRLLRPGLRGPIIDAARARAQSGMGPLEYTEAGRQLLGWDFR